MCTLKHNCANIALRRDASLRNVQISQEDASQHGSSYCDRRSELSMELGATAPSSSSLVDSRRQQITVGRQFELLLLGKAHFDKFLDCSSFWTLDDNRLRYGI